MSIIQFKIDNFYYNEKENQVLNSISFTLEKGEFVSIIGPSGIGKSTILKLLAGLEKLKNGTISINDAIYNSKNDFYTPKEIIYVSQDVSKSLLPWLSVYENVSWALNSTKISKIEKKHLITQALLETGLEDKQKSFPHELSGGQKQRLAIARVLIHKPKVLLLDEPFNSLDFFNRRELENLLRTLWNKKEYTILLVTHEIDEAIYLSNKIFLQNGKPSEIKLKISENLPNNEDDDTIYSDIKKQIKSAMGEENES